MFKDYLEVIGDTPELGKRLKRLAKKRSEEGYMAEIEKLGKDEYRLTEHHCPICVAAQSCAGFCSSELEIFQKVLNAEVVREEHLLNGGRRCTYRIKRVH